MIYILIFLAVHFVSPLTEVGYQFSLLTFKKHFFKKMAYQGFWEDGDFEAIGKLEATKTGQKQKDILLLRYDMDKLRIMIDMFYSHR